MTIREIFEKDKTVYRDFDFNMWDRYYHALNREVPVEKVKDAPYFLKMTENEKICYEISLKELQEDRKKFPQASYELSLKDFD